MPARPRHGCCRRSTPPVGRLFQAASTSRRSTTCSESWSRATMIPRTRKKGGHHVVEAFLGLLKSWTRTTSFVTKEVIEVVRRPGALFSLIFGPFLIMGAFGLGYSGQYKPLNTVLVVPASAGLPREVSFYQ